MENKIPPPAPREPGQGPTIWARERDEFIEVAAQLFFDFGKAVLLIASFWAVSILSHQAMLGLGGNSFSAAALHWLHSIFLVVASSLTLLYTLLRIAVAPVHQLFLTQRRVREELQAEESRQFLDVEMELQAALIRECQMVRFQGFRMNEALKRPEFFSALVALTELRLIFMAPHAEPNDTFQKEHNRKFNESIELLTRLSANAPNLRIELRTTLAAPPENLLVFDEDRARLRPVKAGATAATHRGLIRLSRGRNERELAAVVGRFDSRFSGATVFRVYERWTENASA